MKEDILNAKTLDVTSLKDEIKNLENKNSEQEEPPKKEKKKLSKKQKIVLFSSIGAFLVIAVTVTLVLLFSKSFNVTFNYDNGDANLVVSVKKNESVEKPNVDPQKDGYVFEGWYDGTTKYDFNKKVTSNLTIKAKYNKEDLEIEDIDITPDEISVLVGETTELSIEITPKEILGAEVTFESSKPTIATVDEKGVVTGVKKGIVIITATTKNGKTAQSKIIIEENIIEVESITITPSSASLSVGEKISFTATVNPIDATNQKVSWMIEDRSVASVQNGLVTAIKSGKTNLIVKVGEKTETIPIEVKEVAVTSVEIKANKRYLFDGQGDQLSAIIKPDGAYDRDVTWSLDNNNCASISESGIITASLKSECAGGATKTVTAKTANGKTATVSIVIEPVLKVTKNDLNISNDQVIDLIINEEVVFIANTSVSYKVSCSDSSSLTSTTDTKLTITPKDACTIDITSKAGQTMQFHTSIGS